MNYPSKLKPPIFFILTAILIIGAGIVILIFSEMGILSSDAFKIYQVILFAHASFENTVLFARTRNYGLIPAILLHLNLGTINFIYLFTNEFIVLAPFSVLLFLLVIITLYNYFTKKVSYRHRKVFELAARPVEKTTDGFTPRPYPVGEVHFKKEVITDFAKFLTKNLIAMSYFEKDKIYLVIDQNEWTYARILKPNFKNQTYVSVDYSGKISVNIAKKDYKKYKEEYAFDELCESLGNLFKSFLEYFKDGKQDKIIKMFDNLSDQPLAISDQPLNA